MKLCKDCYYCHKSDKGLYFWRCYYTDKDEINPLNGKQWTRGDAVQCCISRWQDGEKYCKATGEHFKPIGD